MLTFKYSRKYSIMALTSHLKVTYYYHYNILCGNVECVWVIILELYYIICYKYNSYYIIWKCLSLLLHTSYVHTCISHSLYQWLKTVFTANKWSSLFLQQWQKELLNTPLSFFSSFEYISVVFNWTDPSFSLSISIVSTLDQEDHHIL